MGSFPELSDATIQRLDVLGPRYTSYPTVPEWTTDFGAHEWTGALQTLGAAPSRPLGLYIHLPFCEERCTFCGCNVVVTKDPRRADAYIDHLVQEMDLSLSYLGQGRPLTEVHWGGGTPTFLTEGQLERLWSEITARFVLEPGAEVAIEIDPVVTTKAQLRLLRQLGFNRISMGVQDFDPTVQAAVRRVQSVEETQAQVNLARTLGFSSINFDLIYGLPHQTSDSWRRTLDTVLELSPDRMAVYSFAYVPDLRPHQKRLAPAHIPVGATKLALLRDAYDAFVGAGYRPIGMDHFAKPTDELAEASKQRRLHRNFQGYSVKAAEDTVAFGLTAISDLAGHYAQNVPQLNQYYRALDEGRFPVMRGLKLSKDDRRRRRMITDLMCNGRADLGPDGETMFSMELETLAEAAYADLATVDGTEVTLSPLGQIFARNVAMVFDRRLRNTRSSPRFSRTI